VIYFKDAELVQYPKKKKSTNEIYCVEKLQMKSHTMSSEKAMNKILLPFLIYKNS
jgi:hypothetical protein